MTVTEIEFVEGGSRDGVREFEEEERIRRVEREQGRGAAYETFLQ